ncbi:oxidative stress-responsive serine-rich protein 1-like isoform X1 [Acipenser oxyrinchus oxyrinchus]|uniref:Oxidative stress-responsive serine-rich protein 1 n=1 Tax=Acipenser oxyrinchus oxyrinchus TaxID=40147 RepID=A0AAD8CS68_ACIOX|nr:oxidative stress-responsive serine-rich protein 1-like isoform X1 [Acipenser oxyrinchus oxyrinchus]
MCTGLVQQGPQPQPSYQAGRSTTFLKMESEVKDREEESLQTAFKKLRVDAEGSTAAVRVCESASQRTSARANAEGAKPKTVCSKENWHGCARKTSRGAVRSQRRRRSKSPILHPPKFTYCSSKMSPPTCQLKHKSQPDPNQGCLSLRAPAKKELLSTGKSSPVFGATAYAPYSLQPGGAVAPGEFVKSTSTSSEDDDDEGTPKQSTPGSSRSESKLTPNSPSDFQSLSKLSEDKDCSCHQKECQCKNWQGVEVYSFTGLRDVISECERNMAAESVSHSPSQRRTRSSTATSGSPRSCSEQARAYVDDITIEDLSGYMEYYLYIPKKMSHMAEMMYT